jgi:hypothetical protein
LPNCSSVRFRVMGDECGNRSRLFRGVVLFIGVGKSVPFVFCDIDTYWSSNCNPKECSAAGERVT